MANRLTDEQYSALRGVAITYGRTWKSVLRDWWMTGDYPHNVDSQLLQLVRNNLGPTWLVNFRFKPEFYKPFNG